MENQTKDKPKKTSPWTFISNLFKNNRDLDSTLLLTIFTTSFCWYVHICAYKKGFIDTPIAKDVMDMYFLAFPLIISYFFKKESEKNGHDSVFNSNSENSRGFWAFLSRIFRSNRDLDSTMLLVSFMSSFAWYIGICSHSTEFAGSEIAMKVSKMYTMNLALLLSFFFKKGQGNGNGVKPQVKGD